MINISKMKPNSERKITISKATTLANMKKVEFLEVFLEKFKKRHLLHEEGLSSVENAQKEYENIGKVNDIS